MIDLKGNLVQILCDLIAVESVTDNEKELCDVLEKTLREYSGELIREDNSLVLHLDSGKDRRIALCGHIDTVPIGSSSTEASVKDGFVRGRGACDMKSGLASMLKILHEIESGVIQPEHNISFIFYEGEEGPIPNGINTLLEREHLNDIDFAFILEPTEGNYSVGCLGSLAIKKEIFGVSAHSANPKTGLNALDEALSVYEKIKQMNSRIDELQSIDGLEYYETVNVTSLNTFNAFNVLPPKAELIVNFRFGPHRTIEEARELLFSVMGSENTSKIDEVSSSYMGSDNREFLLPGIRSEIMQAWTDIAQLNEAGIPAINFGPGSIKYAHKPDERINISDFEDYFKKLKKHI